MMIPTQATNALYLRRGEFSPYNNQPGIFHCPADWSQTNGAPRVRSYSMNGWIGSRYMTSEVSQYTYGESGYRTYVKESETAVVGAASLWVIMDEHEATIDDAWFVVTMNDSDVFASLPANRHQRGYNLSFADGHVEHYILRDPTSLSPGKHLTPQNPDWLKLKQVTTTALGAY